MSRAFPIVGIGPATRKLLDRPARTIGAVDLVELSEALRPRRCWSGHEPASW